MKSKNFNQADKFHFGIFAVIVLIGAGLMLAVYSPEIKSWQMAEADKIITLAAKAQAKDKVNYLEQAMLVNGGDPLATEYLAEYYKQIGEYKKAISTYQSSPYSADGVYLGNLALKVGNYSLAETLYTKANQKSQSAESLAGLALAKLAQGKTEQGCIEVEKARKQNLSSPMVADVTVVCEIQQGSSKLGPRQQAYAYTKVGLTEKAIGLFENLPSKSTNDYLVLASLYKTKGDSQKTLSTIWAGLDINPTSKELLTAIILELKNNAGSGGEVASYENRLDDLQFKNFQ